MYSGKLNFKLILAGILSFGILVSCSKNAGYGVVNWSLPEYNLAAGDIVPVLVRSNVAKSYIVEIGDNHEKKEIPLGKLMFFTKKKDAEYYQAKISENAFLYATVLFDGLPIRKEPENISKQIYRLRENQKIKILWQGEGVPVLKNGEPLPGDWYMVMTDDGTRGWCFSLNLHIYDERKEEQASEKPVVENDEILLAVLNSQWYPESYAKMLDINRVDIENISADYGFFPGIKTKVAHIMLKDTNRSFSYSNIAKGEANLYNFEGSNLSMQVRSKNRIAVQFTDQKGMPDVEYFVTLPKPLDEIIADENARRQEIIRQVVNIGRQLHSESYGTLTIDDKGSFEWKNFAVLSGKIIPRAAGNTGTVKVRFFVSPKLASSYDAVLSFYFDGVNDSVDFLARITQDTLTLEFVSKDNIVDSVVEKLNKQQVISVFSK